MVKQRNRYTFTSNRPKQLDSFDQCRFWLRLDELSTNAESQGRKQRIDHLKSSVRKVADRANWISTQVCRFMPQYTLHEERHFLNVLAIMDALMPDDVIARFGALDCVLPMLAAYTHDLGMALSQHEHDGLQDESTAQGAHFARYRTRFDEELRQLERWKKRRDELAGNRDAKSQHESAAARKRIDVIEGHILASYLRDTHTEDDQVKRLRRWLDLIKQEAGDDNVFRYGVSGKDFQRELALIGISHGRGALWLRRQLIDGGPDDGFFQLVATGESANLAFPSLLLRLADVMDFDVSRAPRILFKHFGIENDQSVLEWNKHLSIVGWRLDVDPTGKQQPDLLYSAECQHPVHEKAIREFKTWIDAELSAVRIELDAQRRQLPTVAQDRYHLHLPSQTRLDIRPARDTLTDQPKYVYHDLQFRLDQDEIQQLLMGESLYGDPGLCIRELLQNALDALELRELRLKMKKKGEAGEPVDGELIRPGWVRELDGREEELRVTLDWGTDEETGQQWLRVTDNGVGMTEEVIKNYFTQIGKSYYRSPEFNQERAAMNAAGEAVSPISIFGIGILSCFMIADRVQLRTRPGAVQTVERPHRDIMISGPGSLFWMHPGTLQSQGTEITVHLKSSCKLQSTSMTALREPLRNHFRYRGRFSTDLRGPEGVCPIWVVLSSIVWPRHPVILNLQGGQTVRIDDEFHANVLVDVSAKDVKATAVRWGFPLAVGAKLSWHFWDWHDEHGTGSRLRLWFVQSSACGRTIGLPVDSLAGALNCQQDELSALAHPVECGSGYTMVSVNGMHIENTASVGPYLEVMAGVGTMMWLDLRGAAVPRLTVNRQKAVLPDKRDDWEEAIHQVFSRAIDAIRAETASDASLVRNLRSGYLWHHAPEQPSPKNAVTTEIDFVERFRPSWFKDADVCGLRIAVIRLLQSLVVEERALGLRHSLVRDPMLKEFVNLFRVGTLSQHGFANELDTDFMIECAENVVEFWASELGIEIDLQRPRAPVLTESFVPYLYAFLLQEAFGPDLSQSWAPLELFNASGRIGDATLGGPGVTMLAYESDDRAVRFADPDGTTPAELVQSGYDLTFPMTAVPLGQLRRECAEWRNDRWYRSLGVAPFLLPALHDVWPKHAELLQETFKVPHIYCLFPRLELWSKRFFDWTDADWHDTENLSALWDLSGHLTGTPGQVLWTRGTHDINEMPMVGLRAPEFFQKDSSKA